MRYPDVTVHPAEGERSHTKWGYIAMVMNALKEAGVSQDEVNYYAKYGSVAFRLDGWRGLAKVTESWVHVA